MSTENNNGQGEATLLPSAVEAKPICGIVMPISALDGCTEHHWNEVKSLISDAVGSVGFTSSLVSDADDIGIIQKRIIQNLYENPIVVCDVSGKNPNVMFELGMRLAFDKPTVIIKDDRTAYSFDTSPIEHLEYPRDLRYSRIVEFKAILGEKVRGTYERSQKDHNYTTFLKHFGQFSVANIDTKEVSGERFIIEELKELRSLLLSMRRDAADNKPSTPVVKRSLEDYIQLKVDEVIANGVLPSMISGGPVDRDAIAKEVVKSIFTDGTNPKIFASALKVARQELDGRLSTGT